MLYDIDYFIVCHDQNIILKQISDGTFNSLCNYRFLFVGNEPVDRLDQYDSQIIVCRNLDYNIEEYPCLCSFTAWYAVVKNQICKTDHMVLLEYDTLIKSNLHTNNIQNNEVITYSRTLLNHYVFYKSTPWLEISLKEVYNIDLATFIQTHKNLYKYWPTTTNVGLSRNILDSFVDWFLPMADIFKDYPLGSYVHERAFFVFCVLNNIKITFQDSVLSHNQLRSHKSNDIYGQFLETKNTTIFHHSMIPEYDRLYSLHFEQCLKNK